MLPRSAVVIVWLLSLFGAGCFPVVNPGYISMPARAPGRVDLQIQGGSGYGHLGWGAVHVEPYATPRLSVPMGIIALYPGAGAARVGLRYRLGGVLSLGGGIGPTFFFLGSEDFEAGIEGFVDLELGLGHRWKWFGLSFAFRPTYTYPGIQMVSFPLNLAFAFYVSKHWAVNLLVHGGVGVFVGSGRGFAAAGGGGIGVLGHL